MDATDSGRDPVEELAEEFIERRRRGETPTFEEYASQFPELAEEIRLLFPALLMMEKLGAETGDPEANVEPALDRPRPRSRPPLEHLGDFRILREVGRGGMGIVYEAEQESLGRRVALKVLAGHRTLDRGQVRRFEREARSAARLHHTNIVPVFGVGEEDGLHYYVMQFIQGQGLDEVLAELKRLRTTEPKCAAATADQVGKTEVRGQADEAPAARVAESLLSGEFRCGPSGQGDKTAAYSTAIDRPHASDAASGLRCESGSSVTLPGRSELSTVGKSEHQYARSVARIGIQVADALEYANAQGILHRDIKPSNLLLDLKGTVWVTDFGLAKATDGNDLTHTGDIVGTLRYMAPERFRGRCDARADVYSLGLTLYELLALRPAYDESDRQQLVQQVTQQQPARLRKLNPAVPRDLATIIHKAIAPEPNDRYPTAAALAEDLQRFIDDKPIRARHIYLAERLLRWGRRNPTVSGLSAAVLFLLLTVVVVSSVATVWLSKSLRDTNDKLWGSYVAQARAGRLTRQPGQRFDSLQAVREALKLPLPAGRSLDELRAEAIASLCVADDLEVLKKWDGCPTGAGAWAIDDAFERYARDDSQGNVSVRRIADDQELLRLPGEGTSLWGYGGLEFSPDGRFLHLMWLSPQGFRGRLWRLDQAEPVAAILDDHLHLAFRPDSQVFAASFPDGSIRLFDAETMRETRRFPNSLPQAETMLRWNPRLPQLAIRTGATCRVMSVDSGEIQAELSVPGHCEGMDWHPAGRMVAMSSQQDMKIYLYEVAGSRLVLPPLEGHKSPGIMMCFNHAGDRLVSNDWKSILRLWDVRTGRQLLAQPAQGTCLAFSRDDRVLAADVSLPSVRLFHCRTGHELRTVVGRTAGTAEGYKGHCAVSGDGRLVALWAADGVALVDIWRGEEVATLSLWGIGQPFYFEPRDEALWTSGQSGVLRWPLQTDPVTGKLHLGPSQTLDAAARVCTAESSADGQLICIPQFDEGAWLWRRRTNERIILGPQNDVRMAAVSPDGKWVATGSHELKQGAGAKVWDGETGRPVTDLPVGAFCAVRFSPDGRWLVTTSGGPRIWAVGSWQEGPNLGSPRGTSDCCFSADSQVLALEGSPGEVRLVRTEDGEELTRLTAPEQTRLVPQAFTSDGTQLVTLGSETGALHIFDLRAIRSQLLELGLDWDAPPLPSSPATDFERLDVQVELGNIRERLQADELVGQAGQHNSNKEYAKAAEILREAVRVDPTHVEAHNNLAWLLLTAPTEFRDPKEALPLARKVVELAPDQAVYHNTLGVALYRTGHYDDAVGALETSLRQSKGASDAFDLFFLVMCHHRLGETTKAADCRDRAVRWFEEHREKLSAPWVEDLTAFQAEADAALAAAWRTQRKALRGRRESEVWRVPATFNLSSPLRHSIARVPRPCRDCTTACQDSPGILGISF